MKAKNKYQQKIVELSNQLSAITTSQRKFSKSKSGKYASSFYSKIKCHECLNVWKPKIPSEKVTCPSCNSNLKLVNNSKGIFASYVYVFDRIENFQVVRVLCARKEIFPNEKASVYHDEVVQHWIDENGKRTIMGVKQIRFSSYYNFDSWEYNGELSIKEPFGYNNPYMIYTPFIYPKMKLLSSLKRNGFKTSTHGFNAETLFSGLLSNTSVETLFKANQFILAYAAMKQTKKVTKYWKSIKISIRNSYKIKDSSLWFDYLELLDFFNKDLSNPKYVCPANLKAEHNKLVDKKVVKEDTEYNVRYEKEKAHLFNFSISKEKISIEPLRSIKEFKEEGEELEHCVYKNEYYKRKKSLVLSAKYEGKRIETIEIDLNSGSINQCHGFDNNDSKFHDEILRLIQKEVPKICDLHHKYQEAV